MTQMFWRFGGEMLVLKQGDLTQAEVDAIVNAANPGLMGGGGIDGAIHKAAGPQLLEANKQVVKEQGELAPGNAVMVPGFGLKAKHVIHTVGPVWRGGGQGEEEVLRAAYTNSLDLAAEKGLATIAFPAISCGAYGYPEKMAAPVALEAMKQGVSQRKVQEAFLYVYSLSAFQTWSDLAKDILGEPQIL
ncbi:MAG: RNase III inhibitor [Desulfovibrio sp.]|nr:MAG: RNase III inhibitor [Desulfovibrio sp.]